jgi:hypothetical protein
LETLGKVRLRLELAPTLAFVVVVLVLVDVEDDELDDSAIPVLIVKIGPSTETHLFPRKKLAKAEKKLVGFGLR